MGGVELEGGGAMPEAGVDAARVEAGPEGALDPVHADLHALVDSFSAASRTALRAHLMPGEQQYYSEAGERVALDPLRDGLQSGGTGQVYAPSELEGRHLDAEGLGKFTELCGNETTSFDLLQNTLKDVDDRFQNRGLLTKVLEYFNIGGFRAAAETHKANMETAKDSLRAKYYAENNIKPELHAALPGTAQEYLRARMVESYQADPSLERHINPGYDANTQGIFPDLDGADNVALRRFAIADRARRADAELPAAREAPAEEADDRLAELTARLEKANAEHEERLTAAAAPPPAVDEEEGDDDDGVPMTQDEINALLAKIDAEED